MPADDVTEEPPADGPASGSNVTPPRSRRGGTRRRVDVRGLVDAELSGVGDDLVPSPTARAADHKGSAAPASATAEPADGDREEALARLSTAVDDLAVERNRLLAVLEPGTVPPPRPASPATSTGLLAAAAALRAEIRSLRQRTRAANPEPVATAAAVADAAAATTSEEVDEEGPLPAWLVALLVASALLCLVGLVLIVRQ